MNNNASSTYKEIKSLFWNKHLSESETLTQLRSILENNPNVILEQDFRGYTLLHIAAEHSDPVYCKLLLEFDSSGESLKLSNTNGELPFHIACACTNIETAKFLLEAYPESINAIANGGYNCLHVLIIGGEHNRRSTIVTRTIEFAQFLLKHSPGLISATARNGNLPLHIACRFKRRLPFVKFLYNEYPEAIYVENSDGYNPLGLASVRVRVRVAQELGFYEDVISFFQYQLAILDEAGNVLTPDSAGKLPIHRVMLHEHISVGTVKLMIDSNPESVLIADLYGTIPLHLACQHCGVDIIKCLVNSDPSTLQIKDSSGNLPIHIACRFGMCDAVQWILESADGSGVSMENKDGKLPIQLLLCEASYRGSLEYVQTVNALLRAHPEAVAHLLA